MNKNSYIKKRVNYIRKCIFNTMYVFVIPVVIASAIGYDNLENSNLKDLFDWLPGYSEHPLRIILGAMLIFMIIIYTIFFFIDPDLKKINTHQGKEDNMKKDHSVDRTIILIVFIVFFTILIFFLFRDKKGDENGFITFLNIFLMPLTTIGIAYFITKKVTEESDKKNLEVISKNRIDSESKWRKNLMDIASKYDITLDDVYRVRASLRYKKKDSPVAYSFEYMSNEIHDYCESLIESFKSIEGNVDSDFKVEDYTVHIVNENKKEKIRIYCRYLLKNHWEEYINVEKKPDKSDKDLWAKDTQYLISSIRSNHLTRKRVYRYRDR